MMDNIYNKINCIELLYIDILHKNNRIINILLSNYKKDNLESSTKDIAKTFNNIKLHDKNINEKIDFLSNYKNNRIKIDDEYNDKLKDILGSDSEINKVFYETHDE